MSLLPSRRTVLAGTGFLAAGVLEGCGPAARYAYRYALTLEVEADGVVHRGTNVAQVVRRVQPPPPGMTGIGAILGAVVTGGPGMIDLGRDRPLIVRTTRLESIDEPRPPRHWDLITPEPVLARIYGVPYDDEWDDVSGSPMLDALTRARGAHDIGLEDLPTLATYAKPGDLRAEPVRVDPLDLAATFGPNVAIRRATLEVTSRMITLSGLQRIESARVG